MTVICMKAQVYDRIKTVMEIEIKFSRRLIPEGTVGTVQECYERPKEGYSVDLTIPDISVPGGLDYENVILYPEQFTVIKNTPEEEQLKSTYQDIDYEVPPITPDQTSGNNDLVQPIQQPFPGTDL